MSDIKDKSKIVTKRFSGSIEFAMRVERRGGAYDFRIYANGELIGESDSEDVASDVTSYILREFEKRDKQP